MYRDPVEHQEDEAPTGGGLRSRIRGWVGQWRNLRQDSDEEYEDEYDDPIRHAPGRVPAANNTFRVASLRESAITIMPASSFADIQRAADRLKQGEPQIINFEKTPPAIAERLIDFLNGVTYALDGCVEKVAEGAYLFTPANVAIHADTPELQNKPFFDRR